MEFKALRQPFPPGTGRLLIKTLLVMKLTVILVAVTCLQVNAKGYSQTITLSLKNAKLETVFKEIEKQTGYNFFYGDVELKKARTVDLEVKEASLEKVLQLCLSNQQITYSIVDKVIILRSKDEKKMDGQSMLPLLPIDVKGKVTNEKGEPAEGVTVTIKGTKIATSTDVNGEFSLSSVDKDAVLIFTSVNMETFELKVSGKTELAIKLKTKISALDDVQVTVNTGYEKIPKERATGSFGFVNNEELNRRVGPDILSRLEGVTTGIFFDRRSLPPNTNTIETNNIIIRGLSTLSVSIKSPLIILNNFPYEGDINNINPNDVENVTILKDAAAASIWGARAANGVIVVTTKQGQFNQRTNLTITSNYNFIEKPNLFCYPRMTSSEFIEVESFLFSKGFYDGDINNATSYPALSPVVEILAKQRAGILSQAQAKEQIDVLRLSDVRNDFDKYFYRTALNKQYYLNLNGGGQNFKYSLSGGFDEVMNNLGGDGNQRVSLRSDNTFSPLKNFDINFGIAFANINSENNSIGNFGTNSFDYRTSKRLYPYAQFADDNGNPLPIAKDYRAGYTDTAGAGKLLDWKYRPLEELANADNSAKQQDIILSFGSNYKFTKDLSASISYQYQHTNGATRNHFNTNTYFTRDLINRFANTQGNSIVYNLPNGGILNQNVFDLTSHIGRGQVNYNKNWKNKHQVIAIAGGEIREKISTNNTERSYGYNDQILSTAAVDYITLHPIYGNRGLQRIPQIKGFSKTTDHFVSYYTNAAYTFDNRYTVSASARRDASNLFGVETNDKWRPFWSVGAAWNIANESFFNKSLFSSLKLRGTYGYSGNVNNSLAPYTIISYYSASANPITNLPGANMSVPANPGLTWENVKQINIGIDFQLLKKRISGSIEGFKKNAEDLILRALIDPTTGIPSVNKNSANMIGKGVEVSLNTVNLNLPLKWITEFGLSYVSNKVTNTLLNEALFRIGTFVSGDGRSIRTIEGITPYAMFSYPFAGLDPDNGDPLGFLGKDVSKDYLAISQQRFDTANMIYHGSAIPTVFGYLNNIFSFKGITLNIGISYRVNYYFRKPTILYSELYNSGESHPDFAKRWQKPGDESFTAVPSMIYPSNSRRDEFYAYSTVNTLKADNIRLELIRLSYDFNTSTASRLPVRHFRVFFNSENLGIIWRANKESLDPDYNSGNAAYPVPKRFAVGAQFDF